MKSIPDLSKETMEITAWRVFNAEKIEKSPEEFIQKVFSIVRKEHPLPSELSDCFEKHELNAVVSLLHRWDAAKAKPGKGWRISENNNSSDPSVAKDSTGNVETFRPESSDMKPTMSWEECRDILVEELRKGPVPVEEIDDLFEIKFGEDEMKRNLEKIAYAMEQIRKNKVVIIGPAPEDKEGAQWSLLEE